MRIFLALFLVFKNPYFRASIIFLAALTDFLDGYLARKLKVVSSLGTYLDPIADKIFALVAVIFFTLEGKIASINIALFFLRDLSLLIFIGYLLVRKSLFSFNCQSVLAGKLTTALQLAILFFITINVAIPGFVYLIFIPLALFFFIDLYLSLGYV